VIVAEGSMENPKLYAFRVFEKGDPVPETVAYTSLSLPILPAFVHEVPVPLRPLPFAGNFSIVVEAGPHVVDEVKAILVPPWQIVAPEVVGALVTVTTVGVDVVEQPLALVTVTVYDPEELTVIAWVVAPVLHSHEDPAEAVSVTLPPQPRLVDPDGEIVAEGGFMITKLAEVRQPGAAVHSA
jgi:hypothetical protein